MSNFLSTSALDADTLKANFITYLQSQTQFEDYDFTGSNMSVLLDVLVQNTMYNNHYLNMTGAESFLDTANLRESIVSRAKELNYTPRSRTSARAVVTVSITPGDSPNSITIPKGYKFTTSINNQTFTFTTNEAHVISRDGSTYEITDVNIYEGQLVTEYYTASTTITDGITSYNNRFFLNSENVDKSSIEVWVTSNNIRTKWTLASSLFGLTPSSKKYFIQGYKANQYEVVFGDGIIGEALNNADLVEILFRDTLGSDANGINVFNKTSAIDTYTNITVTTTMASYGGSERESNDNLKYNATRHFQVQERAVIADDYKTMILTNFPEIEAVNAYGGEEINRYGKVIIVMKPTAGTIVTNTLKNRIKNFLITKNIAIEPIIMDLEYFYIKLVSAVRYSQEETTLTANQLKANIISDILALNTNTYNKFKQNVYASVISGVINDSDTSIISNSTFIQIIKRLTPAVNTITTHSIDFGNQLDIEGVEYEFPLEHTPVVESSTFIYTYAEVDYTAWIQDNGNGILRVYTYNNGVKTPLTTVGTVDYTTGIVTFTLGIKSYSSYISFYGRTLSRDIDVSKNDYIILDSADFDITMVENNA